MTPEDDIRWLAELVKAQALAERQALAREYIGYNDRGWMQPRLDALNAKVARCDRVLASLDVGKAGRSHYIKGRPDSGEWYCGGCGYGLESFDGDDPFDSAEQHVIRMFLKESR